MTLSPAPPLPPGTHWQYYAAMPRVKRFNKPQWTAERVLIAYGLFVRDEGVAPATANCESAQAMPSLTTICRFFRGGLARLTAVYTEVYGVVPRRSRHPFAADVLCPLCGQVYHSPNAREFRLHPRCRERNELSTNNDDGSWMCGVAVRDDGDCEWWEDAE